MIKTEWLDRDQVGAQLNAMDPTDSKDSMNSAVSTTRSVFMPGSHRKLHTVNFTL